MLDDVEAMFRSDQPLSLFDRFIMEFLHAATGCAHEMVMVIVLHDFKNRMIVFKMMALDNPCRFKLR